MQLALPGLLQLSSGTGLHADARQSTGSPQAGVPTPYFRMILRP